MLNNENRRCQVEESFDIASIWEFKVHFKCDDKVWMGDDFGSKFTIRKLTSDSSSVFVLQT